MTPTKLLPPLFLLLCSCGTSALTSVPPGHFQIDAGGDAEGIDTGAAVDEDATEGEAGELEAADGDTEADATEATPEGEADATESTPEGDADATETETPDAEPPDSETPDSETPPSWRGSLAQCWTDPACPRVMAIGHGGLWNAVNAPYDSNAAIAAAFTGGMDGVKIDVRVTLDNVPVISHSSPIQAYESLDCSGKKIEEMTADEVTACHRPPSLTVTAGREEEGPKVGAGEGRPTAGAPRFRNWGED